MDSMPPAFRCPYCGEPLVWLPLLWFDRACYHCNRCGGFPDIQDAPGAGNVAAEPPPVQRYGGHRREVLVVDDDHRRSMILIVDPDSCTDYAFDNWTGNVQYKSDVDCDARIAAMQKSQAQNAADRVRSVVEGFRR